MRPRRTEEDVGSQAELEKRQRSRVGELLAIHEMTKLLNDDDPLELFRATLPSPPRCRRNTELFIKVTRRLGHTDEYVRPGQHVFSGRRGGSS